MDFVKQGESSEVREKFASTERYTICRRERESERMIAVINNRLNLKVTENNLI
jgi:hypothetical protein